MGGMNPYMSGYGGGYGMNPYMSGYGSYGMGMAMNPMMSGYGGSNTNDPFKKKMYANTGGLSGGLQHTSTPSNAAAMFDTYGDLYDQYEEEEEDEAPSFTSNID